MDQPLTVVLPMYNRERELHSSILDIFELAPTLPRPLAIVVVDDGSTDETYETACELARQYPRMTVLRQPQRQGLGAALDLVRNQLGHELVVVHDGVSAIDAAQLQALIKVEMPCGDYSSLPTSTASDSSGSRRFTAVRTLHNRMELAHRLVTSFRWMQLEEPLVPRRRIASVPMQNSPMPVEERPSIGLPLPLAQIPLGLLPVSSQS